MDNTLQRVWNVLVTWCDLPREPIQPDLQLDNLDVDSLRLLEISMGLDKEFDTTFPESQIKSAKTVADLAALVSEHTAVTG